MEEKSIFQLRLARIKAWASGDHDTVIRLDKAIERREAEKRKLPLHTKHHVREDTTSINQKGHLEK